MGADDNSGQCILSRIPKRIINCLCLLFLGPRFMPAEKKGYAYQKEQIRRAWNANTFGLYRLFILFLEVAIFVFPTLWITECVQKFKRVKDSTVNFWATDVWVIIRGSLILVFLLSTAYSFRYSCFVRWSVYYFLADILIYTLHVLFLTSSKQAAISESRSLLFLFVNFVEIILGFAVLYILSCGFNHSPLCPLQAVYFSAVTFITLGYGDITPTTPYAQKLVIIELFFTVVFITAAAGSILGRLGTPSAKRRHSS